MDKFAPMYVVFLDEIEPFLRLTLELASLTWLLGSAP